MSILNQEPRPREPLVDASRNITYRWAIFLDALLQTVNQQPTRIDTVTVEAEDAAIGATGLSLGTTSQGLFRVSWFLRVVVPGTVSGEVTLAFRAVDGGVNYVQSGALLNGNTTATVQSGSFIIRRDQGTAVTYETSYASVGATQMAYDLQIVVESVQVNVTI